MYGFINGKSKKNKIKFWYKMEFAAIFQDIKDRETLVILVSELICIFSKSVERMNLLLGHYESYISGRCTTAFYNNSPLV